MRKRSYTKCEGYVVGYKYEVDADGSFYYPIIRRKKLGEISEFQSRRGKAKPAKENAPYTYYETKGGEVREPNLKTEIAILFIVASLVGVAVASIMQNT